MDIFENFKELKNLSPYDFKTKYKENYRDRHTQFEKVCSKILAFYLDPSNKHGLGNLVLSSLFDSLGYFQLPFLNINIKVEIVTHIEDVVLGILVTGDTFALGIENKVLSHVFNPLKKFGRFIDSKGRNVHKVVLSLRTIKWGDEEANIRNNGFRILYYKEWLPVLKKYLSNHHSNSDSNYIELLLDFITTIESILEFKDEHSRLFFKNSNRIDDLIYQYDMFNERVDTAQLGKLVEYKETLIAKTQGEWKVIHGLGLHISLENEGGPPIMIEAKFEKEEFHPLGYLQISIISYTITDWNLYKEALQKHFGEEYLSDTKPLWNKLKLCTLSGNETANAVKELLKYYEILKGVNFHTNKY